MYRCWICNRVVPPRVPARRLVVESRPRTYPERPRANRVVRRRPNGRTRVVRVDDPGGAGREIVREKLVCPACAREPDRLPWLGMEIERQAVGEVPVLAFKGDFDAFAMREGVEAIEAEIEGGRRRLVLNLGGMNMISSSPLGFLIKTHKALRAEGGALVISEPSDHFLSTVRTLGIPEYFETFESDAEAAAAVSGRD